MTVGDRIREARAKAGKTQEEVAKAVNTTKQAIYKYENNIVTNIPMDKLEAIAKALGTTQAYLMGWEDSSVDELPTRKQLTRIITQKDEALELYAQADKLWQEVFDDLAVAVGYEGDVTVAEAQKLTDFIKDRLESSSSDERKAFESIVNSTLDKKVKTITAAEKLSKRSQRLLKQVEKKVGLK